MALRTLRTLRSLTRHSSLCIPERRADARRIAQVQHLGRPFQRGDGVFEAVRVIKDSDGVPALRGRTCTSTDSSAPRAALELPLPPRSHLEARPPRRAVHKSNCRAALDHGLHAIDALRTGGEGGYVRLMVTRGGGAPGYGHHLPDLDAPPNAYCVWQPINEDDSRTFALEPMCALAPRRVQPGLGHDQVARLRREHALGAPGSQDWRGRRFVAGPKAGVLPDDGPLGDGPCSTGRTSPWPGSRTRCSRCLCDCVEIKT